MNRESAGLSFFSLQLFFQMKVKHEPEIVHGIYAGTSMYKQIQVHMHMHIRLQQYRKIRVHVQVNKSNIGISFICFRLYHFPHHQ